MLVNFNAVWSRHKTKENILYYNLVPRARKANSDIRWNFEATMTSC